MADSMCGPSNAAKGLVAHANRDRSIHQDRFVANQVSGNANFRSQGQFGLGNPEAEFQAFQSGMAPQPMNTMGGIEPMQFAGPSRPLQTPSFMPAAGNSHQMSAHDFQQWQMSRQAVDSVTSHVERLALQPQHPEQQRMEQLQHQLSGQDSFSQQNFHPAYQQTSFSPYAPTTFGAYGHTPQMQLPIQSTSTTAIAPAQPAFAQMDDAAFEAAFSQIEDVQANDQEFNEAMGEWMQHHGPTAEERAAEAAAHLDDNLVPTQQQQQMNEPTVIQDVRTEAQIKEEQAKAKRQQQHDLARAASEIVAAVGDNESDKFKKSSFFDLMRRIQANEVIVDGAALVDSETGAVVVPKFSGEDENIEGEAGTGVEAV